MSLYPTAKWVAERLNRTILEKVRSLLSEIGLGEAFWAEASSTVVYMINRTPSILLEFKVPEEVWSGRAPEYEHMRRFGCLVYYHMDQGKLKPRAKRGIFMGYPQGVKCYMIWNLEGKKIVVSRNVSFYENVVYKDINDTSVIHVQSEKSRKQATFLLPKGGVSLTDDHEAESESESGKEETPKDLRNYMLVRDRQKRTIKPPSRYDDGDVVYPFRVLGSMT